ncbi:MAG TPA: NAD(P)/FAD-dependent oxidoreductase [Burkholderiaceae bacterium]|nr:NAD(P)/FAD-dependent oxidoreductase [Burkholderiaceae bacterium]
MQEDLAHVVIIGCGFGGLHAAKALRDAPVRVTVLDRTNHHLFQPLLYQVAMAGLSAPSVASPIRYVLRKQSNATVLLAEAQRVDPAQRMVHTDIGPIHYDALILATGARTSYFSSPQWEAVAPGLKTLADALNMRKRVLEAFERAEAQDDLAERQADLTFAIVGGGPTGVELAGTLAEIARHTLADEFKRIDPRSARVVLLEGGPRVLPTFSERSSERARRALITLGVEVLTGARVRDIDAHGLTYTVGDEAPQRLASRTVLWGAGVQGTPIATTLGLTLDRGGRVPVQADLSLANHPEVFVVGDLASLTIEGKAVPGVAPAAKQMGKHAARNVVARLKGAATTPFRYRDYGSLATIGRNQGVVEIGRLRLWGWPGWAFWLFAHVYFLIGFRNRLVTLLDWAFSYFSFERYARIISADDKREARMQEAPPSS